MNKYIFLDVAYTYRAVKDEVDAAYAKVMESGMYIGGNELAGFEAEFAAYCGTQACVGVGNGLEALVLPLKAWEVGPGDEIIVPANTFIATWLAAAQTGATLVPVDADPCTMNMDLAAVEAAITSRTRVIMPVHLYGQPVPMTALMQLAEKHGIKVLEDAAQAHGATDVGVRAGALGHAAGFSFYPGKNLGAFGDGGAFVSRDPELAQTVRMMANYGSREKYRHERVGTNSRLDPLQAAFLAAKLRHLDAWTGRRRDIAAVYSSKLNAVEGLTLPGIADGVESAWHLYVVRHDKRDALQGALAERGVATALHYPIPNHRSGAFRDAFGHMSFPVTESICSTCLSLPIGPHLGVEQAEDIAAIVADTVRSL